MKYEIRSTKQIEMTKIQNPKQADVAAFWSFGHSDFDIRYSDFF
jgi:hypothetical protein